MRDEMQSLAEVGPDRTVAVRRILFECVRDRCAELGLTEGDRLRVGERDGRRVVVRAGDGRVVGCPVELARFVEVGWSMDG